jgi:CheY-like chemotaxis protein
MPKRILVIDDDAATLDVIQEALVYEGFIVKTTCETDDIIKLVDEYRPDVLLLDYILRGVNGGELCSQLKYDQCTSHLPVIIISAHPRVLQSLGDYGCNAFIPKPFDLSDLVNKVNTFAKLSPELSN